MRVRTHTHTHTHTHTRTHAHKRPPIQVHVYLYNCTYISHYPHTPVRVYVLTHCTQTKVPHNTPPHTDVQKQAYTQAKNHRQKKNTHTRTHAHTDRCAKTHPHPHPQLVKTGVAAHHILQHGINTVELVWQQSMGKLCGTQLFSSAQPAICHCLYVSHYLKALEGCKTTHGTLLDTALLRQHIISKPFQLF